MPQNSIRWVVSDGSPLPAAQGVAPHNAHISDGFVQSVLDGTALADVSMLAFRDPESFVAGNLHCHYGFWEFIARSAPCDLANSVLTWIRDFVNIFDFFQPFKGQFKGERFNSDIPPARIFANNPSCESFADFVNESIAAGLKSGAISLWGKVGNSPPHLVMPLTIEPSKPRLCHDNRFLNLWIKDSPFRLDNLAMIPRYVSKGSFQSVCDDKSGYHHILLSPDSRKFFGFQWNGYYYVSNAIPFGWKSSAYIYHSTGLLATHYFRSIGIPCLLYIDDRHNGEISFSRVTPVYAALPSDRERAFARASSAIFIVCYTLSFLGYFIGLKKSILVPRQCVPYLGFGIDSVRQAFTLLEDKRLKFIALVELILSSNTVDVRTLQRFAGKCISFSYAVPGARLFTNEVNLAISRGLRSSRQLRVAGPLLEEVQHWTFLRSWHGCLPWLKESHAQIQLASDASSFAWGGVLGPYSEPVSIRDYWPLSDLGHNIAVKETLALVNVLEAFSHSVQGHRVDVFTDSQALIRSWNRQGAKSHQLSDALKKLFWLSTSHFFQLNLFYVPSALNPADPPSRSLSLQDSKLSGDPWRRIQSEFGPHSADLMALPSNVQVSLDGSPLPFFSPYPIAGSAGVNLFAQSPALLPAIFSNPYAFPPISLIPQVHRYLRESSVQQYTLCVPDITPRQFWWPCFSSQAAASFLLSPRGSLGIVLAPTREGFSSEWPLPWDLWVFHFSFS